MRRRCKLLAAVLGLCVAAAPAYADAINGDWCKDAATLHIEFPSTIRIQSGKDVAGDCSRHACHYKVPAGEKDGGAEMLLQLINEDTMELFNGATKAPPETWKRCQPVS